MKIGVYDMHHVFIDFEQEEDHRNVYHRNFLSICGMQMKLLKWTTDFKLEKETTLAPVWVNLPDLPWHYFEWDALCRILAPIGTQIITDKATLSKTRPTTTKVKVEIDVTRPPLKEVQIEITNSKGMNECLVQKLEFEAIPEFCFKCKVQGHSDANCRVLYPELRNEYANEGKEGTTSTSASIASDKIQEHTKDNGMQVDTIRNQGTKLQTDIDTNMEPEKCQEEEGGPQ